MTTSLRDTAMLISKELPPNYEDIIAHFPSVKGREGMIFTYGRYVYAPFLKVDVASDVLYHESIHRTQQGDDPESWWDEYLIDQYFRFEQELEAYHAQWGFGSVGLGRTEKRAYLRRLASNLASPIYGGICSPSEAKQAIVSGIFL